MTGRPLLDNRADAALFTGRESELDMFDSALEHKFNCLVTGDAGMGKTSLLRAMMYRARTQIDGLGVARKDAMTYVRAEGITSGGELLGRIARGVLGEHYSPALLSDADATLRQLAGMREHDDRAARTGSRRSLVIIVDDVTASAGHEVFGLLRDELWELGYVWVVAARSAERGGLLVPPADAFFERVITMSALSSGEATELITKRLGEVPGAWAAEAGSVVGGNPRRLLDVAREVIAGKVPAECVLGSIADRDAAIAKLGRPEAMLAAELDALGAAAASDDALLSRLGWTRSRAVQVFTHLEEAGLVLAEDVRSGQGRPRKVFRLIPPAKATRNRTESGSAA